jgi:FAD/FMN-containing dehydrogenase
VPLTFPSHAAAVLPLHREINRVFDPKNLFNPGKKLAR